MASKLDIVFCIGDGMSQWSPETIKKVGNGGSEIMACELAKRLAALGHRVRMYVGCGEDGEGIYDGVEYLLSNRYQGLTCDILIVSRNAAMIDDGWYISAKLKLLWVHDVWAGNAKNERLLKYDRILALSQWHKENLIRAHNIHPQHVLVTRNGIDLKRFERTDIVKKRFKCINSSSPDRSWPVMLCVWPTIKAQVKDAELHLFYGFENWKKSAQFNPGQPELIERLEKQIEEMKPLGVVYHDRVGQKELSEEIMSSGVWTHLTWFTESSCISAMEMQAGGVRMVTSAIAALNETVGNRGVLIQGEWTSPEYQKQFIDATVKALTYEDDNDRKLLQQYAQEHFGLDELAKDWEKMFFNLMEELKTNPIVPYMPTQSYR